jgi:hypothetical protein
MGDWHGGCHPGVASQAILTQRPTSAGLTLLAAAERTSDRRAAQHSSVRSQQQLALVYTRPRRQMPPH